MPMATPKGDLTASMAILSLLVRQAGTPSHLRMRMNREFPHGRWSRSIVHGDVPNLLRRGLIRRVGEGGRRSEDVYEATPEGVAALRGWLREAARAPRPLRDAMQLWLEHSDESELPDVIAVLRELELDARADFEAAQIRLNTERALGRLGPADGSDWHGRVRDAVLGDLVATCGHRVMQLKRLRRKIENEGRDLHREVDRDG
jgi:DNA-binding MarR family transcriptional regulator